MRIDLIIFNESTVSAPVRANDIDASIPSLYAKRPLVLATEIAVV